MLITEPKLLHSYDAANRKWQGIPSMEATRGHRLYAAFYSGGETEQMGNYCLLTMSEDGGETWSGPVAVADMGRDYRCYDPCLWIDPLDRLWFLWAQAPEHGIYASICEHPDAKELHFSQPRLIGCDVMMNKPIVTSSKEWLFPMAVWGNEVVAVPPASKHAMPRLAYAVKTEDCGKSFAVLGGVNARNRSYDEHMLVELRDGRLLMLIRTTYGIAKSYSNDGGYTWSESQDSGLGGPNSRFHIRRLSSGNILLVNHYRYTGRNNLAAMLSRDDCETWEGVLMLDERDNVSYPDVAERDGFLYIIYDRERGARYDPAKDYSDSAKEIAFARVTEDDLFAGRIVNPKSKLKGVVSRL